MTSTKTLEYDLKVKEIITDDAEKVKSMIQLHYPSQNMDIDKTEVKIEDGKVIIHMDEMTRFDNRSYMDVTLARFRIARDIWENIEGVEKVEFADVFEKRDMEPEEKEEEVEDAGEE